MHSWWGYTVVTLAMEIIRYTRYKDIKYPPRI